MKFEITSTASFDLTNSPPNGVQGSFAINSYSVVKTSLADTTRREIHLGFAEDANMSAVFGFHTNPQGSNYASIGLVSNETILSIANTAGGSVTIGTPAGSAVQFSPTAKLAVDGKIAATEVVVTQNVWADHVLHPDYSLMTLDETERFIRKAGHLPAIPSEAEVRQEGVNVGAMQAKLLAKIEELTLHLIRESKRNGALEAQNKELSERLLLLEQRVGLGNSGPVL